MKWDLNINIDVTNPFKKSRARSIHLTSAIVHEVPETKKLLDPDAVEPLTPYQGNQETRIQAKNKYIIKTPKNPFIYIRDGDFDVVWFNASIFALGCLLHAYSIFVMMTNLNLKMAYNVMWAYVIGMYSALSMTAGAHRYWSHKSYDARLPFRVFLMIGHCIAGQNSLKVWVRDHLIHHKFTETDADPHNTHRGFFFAHVGWLLRRKHPEVILQAQKLNFDHLMDDPVVRFQHKYYFYLYFIFAFVGPSLIPWYFWDESLFNSFFIVYVFRYMNVLHTTWFINSCAHMFGFRPFNHLIEARDHYLMNSISVGEGYHNFHHAFPFDYRSAEDGAWFNTTKWLIDVGALLGQVYNRKVLPSYLATARKEKVQRLILAAKNTEHNHP